MEHFLAVCSAVDGAISCNQAQRYGTGTKMLWLQQRPETDAEEVEKVIEEVPEAAKMRLLFLPLQN